MSSSESSTGYSLNPIRLLCICIRRPIVLHIISSNSSLHRFLKIKKIHTSDGAELKFLYVNDLDGDQSSDGEVDTRLHHNHKKH